MAELMGEDREKYARDHTSGSNDQSDRCQHASCFASQHNTGHVIAGPLIVLWQAIPEKSDRERVKRRAL
jgi:hypothetical protein